MTRLFWTGINVSIILWKKIYVVKHETLPIVLLWRKGGLNRGKEREEKSEERGIKKE